MVATTQLKTTAIRDEIKYLERDAAKSQGSTVKARQAKQVKNEFETALHNYEDEELQYRQRYRDQIARQYKIVNPNATEQEVREASELDWGNSGVFQTAVSSTHVLYPLRSQSRASTNRPPSSAKTAWDNLRLC